MKKQIVLSLSVLMLIAGHELFAPFGRGSAPAPAPVKHADVPPAVNSADVSATLATAEDVANSGVTLADVKAALDDMGNLGNSTPQGKAKAASFITTGKASASSSNHSHKLGRLSRK